LIAAFLLTQGTRHVTPFTVFTPGNIRFGRVLPGAPPWLAQRAAKVLLVHGASPQRAALLLAELRAHHLAVVTLAVAHEPTLEDIEQGCVWRASMPSTPS
jgi:hypothetical protein